MKKNNFLDLTGLSSDQLAELKLELLNEINQCKSQIQLAKSNASANKQYADITWYNKAHQALRIKQQQYQQVLRAMGVKKKEEKRQQQIAIERTFMDVAKERLGWDTFIEIVREAEKRVELQL